MSKRYSIAFKGEIADGFEIAQVKQSFARQFRKSDPVVEKIFSGDQITLAADLEWDRAKSAASRLREFGAVVYLVDPDGQAVPPTQPESANDSDINPILPEATKTVAIAPKSEAHAESTGDESADDSPPTDLTQTAKVRHLTQIMDKRVVSAAPTADRKKAVARYRFDSFMAKGGGSIFKVLTAVFVATFLLIGIARGILLYFFPETAVQHENIGFFGNLYITFLEITDPGNMAQDIYSSIAMKLFAVLAGIAGIVMLSALIAFITTALDQKIYELKRGRSKVIEEDHTLILGWNEQRITEIVRELVIANESESDACVVILADKDKEEMDDALRLRIKNLETTRLVTRSGDVSTLSNLDMVSLESAKSVIILASCDETDSAELKASSDAKAIQTVLATIGNEEGKEDFSIVVEIFNPTHREIVRSSFPDHVITVNTSDILAKLLVQTSRSVGLSVVYNEILSFDGCEMYFYGAEWEGAKFGDIGYRFPDGVPVGIRDKEGNITINPPAEQALNFPDEILIIADDDSTIELLDKAVAVPEKYELSGLRQEQRIERELMIGWTFKSPIIIREFADYIMDGSAIHVLLKNPTDDQVREIEQLQGELDDIDIQILQKDCLSIDDLMSVKPFEYDNIIILAGNEQDGQPLDAGRIDSENIVALLLLRRIFSQYPRESRNTKLITEILDSQNDGLVARAGVQDVIISNRLVSMIMAQISESADIETVYDDIFQEDGSEIYLKPASLYFGSLPITVSFADMMSIAQNREEICIGVKIKSLEPDKESNNGVQLIPEKNTIFELQAEDSLVVLAEDEL